jgi:choline dehydrogenase
LTGFDYVIVGAGSAGCVLANRLTESGRHRVLLLEAGPRDTDPWIHVPLGYGKLFNKRSVNWSYWSEPEAELNGRRIFTPRGKVLGGSSSINGLVYTRGQPEDFDDWETPGWSFGELLPFFRRTRRCCAPGSTAEAGRSQSPTRPSRTSCATPSSRRRRKPGSRATRTSTASARKAPATSS